jgi:hypothetical protein
MFCGRINLEVINDAIILADEVIATQRRCYEMQELVLKRINLKILIL